MNHDNGIESVTNVPDDRYFFHNFLAKQTKTKNNASTMNLNMKQNKNKKKRK